MGPACYRVGCCTGLRCDQLSLFLTSTASWQVAGSSSSPPALDGVTCFLKRRTSSLLSWPALMSSWPALALPRLQLLSSSQLSSMLELLRELLAAASSLCRHQLFVSPPALHVATTHQVFLILPAVCGATSSRLTCATVPLPLPSPRPPLVLDLNAASGVVLPLTRCCRCTLVGAMALVSSDLMTPRFCAIHTRHASSCKGRLRYRIQLGCDSVPMGQM